MKANRKFQIVAHPKRGRPRGSKNKPKAVAPPDAIETLKAEIDEAVKLQRAHFPDDDDAMLRYRAEMYRQYRYKEGRWPGFAELAKKEVATKAAEAAALAALEADDAKARDGIATGEIPQLSE